MSDYEPLSDEMRFWIEFNFQHVASALNVPISVEAEAAILGLSLAQFTGYTAQIEAEIGRLARTLVERADVQAMLDRLNGTVLTIGDSITTYRYSYSRILSALLALRRPDVTLINRSYSGFTSNTGLELTYTQFLDLRPDWVFIMYGANDGKLFGAGDYAKRLVTLDEYRANMTGIVDAFRALSSAQLVLMSVAPVAEALIAADPDFAAARVTWDNADLSRRAEITREIAASRGIRYVDLMGAMTTTPDPALFCPDGLHPNYAGEQLMLEQIIRVLGSN